MAGQEKQIGMSLQCTLDLTVKKPQKQKTSVGQIYDPYKIFRDSPIRGSVICSSHGVKVGTGFSEAEEKPAMEDSNDAAGQQWGEENGQRTVRKGSIILSKKTLAM